MDRSVPVVDTNALRHWLASGDGVPPRIARWALRSVNRARARLRSGTIAAEMDRIVADATSRTRGSGLAIPPVEVSRRRRSRAHTGTQGR